jgi:hypothetical protein
MRIVGSILLSITLATSAAAQNSIPTLLLGEHAIGAPGTTDSPFPGISSVESNGTDFLIATSKDNSYTRTHAMMLVDSSGHPILPRSYAFNSPGDTDGIASNGRDFLVVWGGLGATSGVRVAADGTLLDANPLVIHAVTRTTVFNHDYFGRRSAAWDGSQYVVLTTVERLLSVSFESSEIVTRVGEDGQILQNDLEVNRGSNSALAARNGISVIAWSGSQSSAVGVFVRSMNSAGLLSDPIQISATSSIANAIADGDDGFLVVWCAVLPDSEAGSAAVRAQHLDPGGRPDAPPFTVGAAFTNFTPGGPAVIWDGTSYRVAWTSAATARRRNVIAIQSVHVNATAAVDAPAVTLAYGGNPALAFNGASTLLAWTAHTDLSTRARRADVSGAGQLVHRFFNSQILNSMGFTPSGASVAWTEALGYLQGVNHPEVTSRLTNVSDNTSLPTISDGVYTFIRGLNRPLIISGTVAPFTAKYADGSGQPFAIPTQNLFWIGNGFLCLWTDPAPAADPFAALPLWAQRFDANGTPIDSAPRQIATSFSLSLNFQEPPLGDGVFVGASNTEVLVAYVDLGAALQGILLRGGEIVDVGEIAPPQALANPIEITSDGDDFLVTWISGKNGTNSYIASRRVLANGDMPEPTRIDSPGNDTKDAMATFWTGQNFLVVWSKVVSGGHDLWALRITRDGTLIDYPPQRIGTVNGGAPQWAFKDGMLAIAYQRDSGHEPNTLFTVQSGVYWSFIVTPRRRAAVHL